MNKTSSTPVVAVIAVIVLAVLAIPCLLGALFLGTVFFVSSEPATQQPVIIENEPVKVPSVDPTVAPLPSEEE